MALTQPNRITVTWAADGNKNTIDINRGAGDANNKASYSQGFPQVTMTPKASGGLPPFGRDMNGVLSDVTTVLQYYQAGMTYPFNSAFATAIGGYNKGALCLQADLSGIWVSQKDNNFSDPETHGSDWLPIDNGMLTVALSGSNKTLTPAEGAHPIIKLTGRLTNNIILAFPNFLQAWTVINNATGNYTVTAKTANGSGVLIKRQTDGVGKTYHIVCDGQNILNIGTDSSIRVPTGAVIPHFGVTVPEGYLLANGQAVSRALYPDLFAAIGTKFGSGDESTTFNVPDLIDRFVRFGTADQVGVKVADSIQSHSHTVTQTAHNHGITDSGHIHSATTNPAGNHSHRRGTMEITGSAQFAIRRSGSAGGAMSFANWSSYRGDADGDGNNDSRQLNFKASDGWTGSTSETGAHTHTVTTDAATAGISVNGAMANISINNTGGTETAPMHIFGLPIIKV